MHLGKIGIALVAACHGKTPPAAAPAARHSTVDNVWVLASSGTAPADTTVTLSRRDGRVVVLRHRSADRAVFALVGLPAQRDSTAPADSIHLSIHCAPGEYAIDLASTDKLPAGMTIAFSYALHFEIPAAAAAKYPSATTLEPLVTPALIEGKDVQVIDAKRPAADLVRFAVTKPGHYALVFPR